MNSQNNPEILHENKNSKVCNFKILLDSGTNASILRKDVLYERVAGTFNTIFITEIVLKLPLLNHSTEIYTKWHLTNKFLNYHLILGRDILHEVGIIFKFENKTIT